MRRKGGNDLRWRLRTDSSDRGRLLRSRLGARPAREGRPDGTRHLGLYRSATPPTHGAAPPRRRRADRNLQVRLQCRFEDDEALTVIPSSCIHREYAPSATACIARGRQVCRRAWCGELGCQSRSARSPSRAHRVKHGRHLATGRCPRSLVPSAPHAWPAATNAQPSTTSEDISCRIPKN